MLAVIYDKANCQGLKCWECFGVLGTEEIFKWPTPPTILSELEGYDHMIDDQRKISIMGIWVSFSFLFGWKESGTHGILLRQGNVRVG